MDHNQDDDDKKTPSVPDGSSGKIPAKDADLMGGFFMDLVSDERSKDAAEEVPAPKNEPSLRSASDAVSDKVADDGLGFGVDGGLDAVVDDSLSFGADDGLGTVVGDGSGAVADDGLGVAVDREIPTMQPLSGDAGEKPSGLVLEEDVSGGDVPVSSASAAADEDHLVYKMIEGEGAEGEERRRRIGDELVERGIITKDQLNVALQEKKITGKMLGAILVELGFIGQNILMEFLAEDAGFGVFDLQNAVYDPNAIALFDKKVARQFGVLPVSIDGDDYYFAMSDPQDVVALDTIRRYLPRGARVSPLLASPDQLAQGIDAAYGYASLIKDILKELEEGEVSEDLASLNEDESFSHPIVRLVNALVFEAVKLGVSDLHFEPEENFVRLRYRLDGVLFTAQTLHKQHWSGIAQRLKIMSHMDIADKISPQDGRFNMEVAGREADFRVSSLPTVHGENIVLRVLDKSSSIMPMEALGFSDENREKIRRVQSKPEGIIIVTGPTGSGKTTSLYSMINEINDVEVNIQTLEDPVEYSLPMIRQTHVREGVLDFADGIKALLRQDPDIIFIGEIRDNTTAEMALKAAMTGHQVYTTLHTNDSFGAVPRLIDLGMKPSMLAGAIVAVFAQRLARRLCAHCKIEHTPSEAEERALNFAVGEDRPTIYKANSEGCPHCVHGYKGRVALVEILMFDSAMNDLLAQSSPVSELRKTALQNGFKSMADDGILKVKEGITDFEAISKVVDVFSL